jgi:hypothetical protein
VDITTWIWAATSVGLVIDRDRHVHDPDGFSVQVSVIPTTGPVFEPGGP